MHPKTKLLRNMWVPCCPFSIQVAASAALRRVLCERIIQRQRFCGKACQIASEEQNTDQTVADQPTACGLTSPSETWAWLAGNSFVERRVCCSGRRLLHGPHGDFLPLPMPSEPHSAQNTCLIPVNASMHHLLPGRCGKGEFP